MNNNLLTPSSPPAAGSGRPIHVPVIMSLLRDGPKTNADIASVLGLLPYEVASLMAKLRRRGTVDRTLGHRGRATYRIAAA